MINKIIIYLLFSCFFLVGLVPVPFIDRNLPWVFTTTSPNGSLPANTNIKGLGYSVSIDSGGTLAIAGAYTSIVSGIDYAGTAHVYRYNGTSFIKTADLSEASESNYGTAVAVSPDGNYIAVCSVFNLYVYKRVSDSSWTKVNTITTPNFQPSQEFCKSIEFDNNATYMVVGAPNEWVGGVNAMGRAYIYYRASGDSFSTTPQATFPNPVPVSANRFFGQTVSITNSGSKIAVSADREDFNSSTDSGAVYVFTRTSSTAWSPTPAKIVSYTTQIGAMFGSGIDIDENWLIVGAKGTDGTYTNEGEIHLFNYSNGDWVKILSSYSSSRLANQYFGSSVSLSRDCDNIVVGAIGSGTQGKVFNYTRKRNSILIKNVITATPPYNTSDNLYGSSVSMSYGGRYFAVGGYNATVAAIPSAGILEWFKQ